ncbi:MAG: hypothetical protein AB1846_02175 [Chloroflexota bacterium]
MADSVYSIIRPMGLAGLLDRAISLYRQNFIKFIGIIAIPFVPLMLVQTGLALFSTTSMVEQLDVYTNSSNPFDLFTPSVIGAYTGAILFAILQFVFVSGLATAALTRAVANNYVGKPVEILDSYKSLNNSWVRLIFALLAIVILVILLLVWSIIPCIGWFTGPGLSSFITFVVSPLLVPVIVLERKAVFESLRRAWDLSRSRFWWLVGVALVVTLLGQLIVSGPVFLINVLLQSLLSLIPGGFDAQLVISTIIQNLVAISTNLLYLPLQLTIMTVIYFDLRARAEGLDLALQASTVGGGSEVVELPEIAVQARPPFFTGLDLGRFALLSLAIFTIYILLFAVVMLLGLAVA